MNHSKKGGKNMIDPKLILVLLRRPRLSNSDEIRSDPFWEFGSFGCTGCHSRNIMHPNNMSDLVGARLAFAQGGEDGFKLVFITPPVEVSLQGKYVEARWAIGKMPFKYTEAPILINNDGESDFPLIRLFIAAVNCPTWQRKFACKFRSRKTPLDINMAAEIIQGFDQKYDLQKTSLYASNYIEALPFQPPRIDENREETYQYLLSLSYGVENENRHAARRC